MLDSYCQPVEPAQANKGAGGKGFGHPINNSPMGEAAPILALQGGIVYWGVWAPASSSHRRRTALATASRSGQRGFSGAYGGSLQSRPTCSITTSTSLMAITPSGGLAS